MQKRLLILCFTLITTTSSLIAQLDASLNSIESRLVGLTGQEIMIKGIIKNNGTEIITSIDLKWTDSLSEHSETISGLNISASDQSSFIHPVPYILLEGMQTITVTISNPNGMVDSNTSNDSLSHNMTGYTPAPNRKVLVESAVGTWNGWVPRAYVYMDSLAHLYPDHFIGVNVHNGDTMAIQEYDMGLTFLPGFPGFPSFSLERSEFIVDHTQMELKMLSQLTMPPVAKLTNTVMYDSITRDLSVSITADFLENVSGDYRLNAIIIEHDVTGTGFAFYQQNYYSGWMPMGGYENLPSHVPDSLMVYNHVGRAVLGVFQGTMGSLPQTISSSETHSYTYNYTIPVEYDANNIEVIGILTDTSGVVKNATKTSLGELITSTDQKFANHSAKVYPNPFANELFVELTLSKATPVEVQVFNAQGALVATRAYGQLYGPQVLPFNGNNLPEGMYFMYIKTDEFQVIKKVQLLK